MKSGNDEIRTLDDICKRILISFSTDESQVYDYATIQRKAELGSHKTVKKHVEHLRLKGLVEVGEVWRGGKKYYQIKLSDEGRRTLSEVVKGDEW